MTIINGMARPKTFGEWLKAERDRCDWTQEELGRRVDMTKMTISRYESGPRVPDRDKVLVLARALGADEDEALLVAGYAPLRRRGVSLRTREGHRFTLEYAGEGEPLSDEMLSDILQRIDFDIRLAEEKQKRG